MVNEQYELSTKQAEKAHSDCILGASQNRVTFFTQPWATRRFQSAHCWSGGGVMKRFVCPRDIELRTITKLVFLLFVVDCTIIFFFFLLRHFFIYFSCLPLLFVCPFYHY
jgi:hypothetical protein